MVPKFYAVHRAEGLAIRIARPLEAFRALFRPFIGAVTVVSFRILRLLGVNPADEEEGGSPDELKRLIAESLSGGHLDQGEAGMLTGVFHLHEQEARQVMTPIPAVVTVDTSEDVETALRRAIASGHTRLVVTEDENKDRVKGIVHSNSLAKLLMSEGPHASIESEVRDAPIVPETKPLDDLLADLQRDPQLDRRRDRRVRPRGRHRHDRGHHRGGRGRDHRRDRSRRRRGAPAVQRRLARAGHVAVTDLTDYGLELPVDTDAYNSVGGFVFAQLGRLPAARRHGQGRRLHDPRRVGAREPHRGGAHPPAPARLRPGCGAPTAPSAGSRERPPRQPWPLDGNPGGPAAPRTLPSSLGGAGPARGGSGPVDALGGG